MSLWTYLPVHDIVLHTSATAAVAAAVTSAANAAALAATAMQPMLLHNATATATMTTVCHDYDDSN